MGCIAAEQEMGKLHLQNINLCDKYVPPNSFTYRGKSRSKDENFSRHFLGYGGKYVMTKELKSSNTNLPRVAMKNNSEDNLAKCLSLVKSSGPPVKSKTQDEEQLISITPESSEKTLESNLKISQSPKTEDNNLETTGIRNENQQPPAASLYSGNTLVDQAATSNLSEDDRYFTSDINKGENSTLREVDFHFEGTFNLNL